MKINRFDRYFEKIRPYIAKKLIKAFTGQRRTGKSYLMKKTAAYLVSENRDLNILYIDKERYEFDAIVNYKNLLDFIADHPHSVGKTVFVDEIQEIEDFEKALIHLLNDEWDIYISGSNAKLLSGELATRISGRYIEIEVHPLSYAEYLDENGLEDSNTSFLRYIEFGGLPGLIDLPDKAHVKQEYLRSLYHSIILRDVIRRNQIRNVSFLENLIYFLADNTGNLISAKKISDFLKTQHIQISINTVLDYLQFLCNAFIIRRPLRKDVKGKKTMEINTKYYFEDIGIRNSLVGFKTSDMARILENIVYNHLMFRGYHVTTGKIGDKEIDFVAEKSNETIYIQVAYLLIDASTLEREFGNLLLIPDQYPKYVISYDEPISKVSHKGVQHMSIRDFLMSFE